MKSFFFLIFALLLLFPFQTGNVLAKTSAANDALSIQNLRCESKRNPLGVDVANPHMSWVLQSDQRGQMQTAYRILVATDLDKLKQNIGDAWDSGKVISSQSIKIPYKGTALQSDRTYFWQVRVWDKDGKPMPWSDPSFWSTGLLHDSDWQAQWIGLDKAVGDDDPNAEHTRLSARMLRREFKLKKKIKRATAFVCGLGLFEFYLNGEKIGDQVLAPALSEYNKRAYYMTFDVTAHLVRGENAVGVILGNGRFFAPRHESPTRTKTYGFPKLLMQMNVQYDDGSFETIISDESWKLTTDGPIRANNEYDGEIYDARKEMDHWSEPGFDDSAWGKAEPVEKPGEKMNSQPNEPIKVMENIQPLAVSEPQPGMFIFDMGQNMVGWVQLKVKGKRGQKVTLRFAEVLKDDGTLYLDNIRSAEVTDTYILKGSGTETWEPRFTYHGFRYVEMKGYPGRPGLSSIEGRVVYNAVETTGQFSCSSKLINHIYKNAFWGIRGNYRSMPTDCPQRDERQGWLGDRSAESRGESFIFDIDKLYNKWLYDIQDAQLLNGSLPNVAPSYWPIYSDNTTWPGSYIIIPNMLYDQYGDLETLERHYPNMIKWIQHMRQYVQGGIMPRDTYGDWCVPPVDLKVIHTNDPKRTTSSEFIGTAYFYHELKLMQHFATLLHKTVDADSFRFLAEKMKTAFNERFLDKARVLYGNNSQTSTVLALRFGLVPEKYRERVFKNLVEKIMGESQGHIGTGLIGCQWLMRVLTNNGRPDIAYTLAAQKTYPSWGYMVEHGATTIWELWNGNTGDPAMNSHNHVMLLGDLIVWLYEDLAGIKSDPEHPAFKHIIMRPEPAGDLKFVTAVFRSSCGPIESAWKIDNNKFHWHLSIPANTTATIFVPATGSDVVYESDRLASKANDVQFVREENGRAVYEIKSGQYLFTSNRFETIKPVPFASMPVISPGDTTIAIPNKIMVSMSCKTPAAKIYYTLDGSEPNESSLLYQKPVRIEKNTTIMARAFKDGFHPSASNSAVFDFIDPSKNGIRYELYEGAFTRLPDFQKLRPAVSGSALRMDLSAMKSPDSNFALTFKGFIKIMQKGEYTFYTNSNDGSRLFIDNKLIVDNDGEHGLTEKSGRIKLSSGMHSIRADYFQSGGSKSLSVLYSGPGIVRRTVPGSVLYFENK